MPDHAILGISAFYHDSAAVLLFGNEIVAAAHEERFSRRKHDARFPKHAVRYVLNEGGIDVGDLQAIAFYDKPYLKFERLLETYHAFAPKGLGSFLSAMPVWIKEKLFMRKTLWDSLSALADRAPERKPPLLFPEHHLSHAASAFYPSPFMDAAILTIDGVGEWSTTTIGAGRDAEISIMRELHFPHSVGLLYSAFTYFCGFRVNSGEYKLMGLAPYGNRAGDRYRRYLRTIRDLLVDVHPDGSIDLNLEYFEYPVGLRMCADDLWEELFKLPRREMEAEISEAYTDMAAAVQDVTEEIVLRLAHTARRITGSKYLVMAGGVALNCVANGRLLKEQVFNDIWIQPAAGDAGGALGAALAALYLWTGADRNGSDGHQDAMQGAFLGPFFDRREIERLIRKYGASARLYEDFDELCHVVARLLADGHIVGWFQGRLELGPRALGNRSILGDPRRPDMQKRLNLKIKFREGFRPFAPSVLAEDAPEYFELIHPSPYMLLVAPVKTDLRQAVPENYESLPLYDRLYFHRSSIPAVTHVDFSARIQTVHRKTNERYWKLIRAFKSLTGIGLVVNTSFNVRGEPIVCTPGDAYRCFMQTGMDYLVLGDFLFEKSGQPQWNEPAQAFQPD